MRFAIRDDDTSYFTDPEVLERLWGRTLPYAPVSLAVTPFALQAFHLGDSERYYQADVPQALGDNAALVDWLRARLEGGISVMCHGYAHEYRRVSRFRHVQEYVWKPYERLLRETRLAKHHLESILGRQVHAFVPPGNAISRDGLRAVRPHFQRILATVPLRRLQDIRLEWEYLAGYARRLYYQLRFGAPNPSGETIAGVHLIPSFSLTRRVSWEGIAAKFELCRQLHSDFIVAVHYWEIDLRLRGILDRLLDHAAGHGCKFVHCHELFAGKEEQT